MGRGWDGWFDALRDAGVTELGDQSVGVREGMFTPPQTMPSTIDPNLPQQGQREMRARLQGPSSALQGLYKARIR